MMTCKQYLFTLTSGQLEEASVTQRFWALQHRMMCKRCRNFTRNDARLTTILQHFEAHLIAVDEHQKKHESDR